MFMHLLAMIMVNTDIMHLTNITMAVLGLLIVVKSLLVHVGWISKQLKEILSFG